MRNFPMPTREITLVFVVMIMLTVLLGKAYSATNDLEKAKGGADRIEGWIIKRTKEGNIIKIPKKQIFQFTGSGIEGTIDRPAETLFKPRLSPQESSLIPVRKSFRREALEVTGVQERQKR